jgi:hypothetical protein
MNQRTARAAVRSTSNYLSAMLMLSDAPIAGGSEISRLNFTGLHSRSRSSSSTPVCSIAWCGDIIAAACVHLAATVHLRRIEGTWIAQEYDEHFDARNPVVIEKGRVAIPHLPGLVVKPEPGMSGQPVDTYGS